MAEDFAYLLSRQVVSSLALSSGYMRAESQCLDVLADVMRQHITSIGNIAQENATSSGRTLVNVVDILQALEDTQGHGGQGDCWNNLRTFIFKNPTNIEDPVQRLDGFPLEIPSFPVSRSTVKGRNEGEGIIFDNDYVNMNINKTSIINLEKQLSQLRQNEKRKGGPSSLLSTTTATITEAPATADNSQHIHSSNDSKSNNINMGNISAQFSGDKDKKTGTVLQKPNKPSYIPSFLPDFPPDHCCQYSLSTTTKKEGLIEAYEKDMETKKNIERTILRTKEIEERFKESQNKKQAESETTVAIDGEEQVHNHGSNTSLSGQKRKLDNTESSLQQGLDKERRMETSDYIKEKEGETSNSDDKNGRKRIKLISAKQSREQFK